jgi:hypothetical protein
VSRGEHRLADPVDVDRLERAVGGDLAPQVLAEKAPSESPREKPRVACVGSLVPKPKNSARSASRQARGSSIIVPMRKGTRGEEPRAPRRLNAFQGLSMEIVH